MALANPTAPVINLNGTSAQDLIDEYREAYSAIRKAYEVLQRVTVHGRDFQTAPAGTYEKARAEHHARLAKLQEVENELIELSRLVLLQVEARRR